MRVGRQLGGIWVSRVRCFEPKLCLLSFAVIFRALPPDLSKSCFVSTGIQKGCLRSIRDDQVHQFSHKS